MTVTITLTDPTADDSRAVRAYLDALHGDTSTAPVLPNADGKLIIPAGDGFTSVHEEPASDDDTGPSAEDAGAPDFDSAGMPWDERIHASSRATVADGTWRKKRGVSPEEVAAVEATLIQEGISDPEQEQAAQEVPEAPSPDHITADDMAEADANAADAPPPPPAATPNPFLTVMSRIGKSKLDKAKKDELLTAAGALDDKGHPSILVLNKRPELIDGFVGLLDSEGV